MDSVVENITDKLAKLDAHNRLEQKSQLWLDARKNLITASESGYFIGIRSPSGIITYLKNKLNLASSNDNLKFHPAIKHGNIYEDITRIIYETRNDVKVKEYGLITTPKTIFLGASPDGIVYSATGILGEHRVGRLVEIKNPYTYDPSDKIKPEYMVQIYQLQYVLELSHCDFIKTNIIGSIVNDQTADSGYKPYVNIDEFLADIPTRIGNTIANSRIPRNNHSRHGMEKGILIYFNHPDTMEILREIYPIDKPYEKLEILEWIKQTKTKISSQYTIPISNIAVEYWYVAEYFENTIEYQPAIFEKYYLPRLQIMWQLVSRLRQLITLHPTSVIINFLNNTLLEHFKTITKIIKSVDDTNHNIIIKHLEKSLTLEPISSTASIQIAKPISDKTSSDKSNSDKTSSNKIIRKSKKVEIEYDF